MADENVPAPAPTRSNDQILLFAAWAKTGAYNFQLDETRLVLDANLLRDALEITPIDQAHQFVSPPSGDEIIDFVNQLGYTKVIHFVSRMAMNNLYQPWRAILSMINQRLTGHTSRHDRPRYPEFIQAIKTFLIDKANLGSPTKKDRKDKPHVIPYCKIDEVFGITIPNALISNNIKNAPYYNAYLEMVAKHDQKVTTKKEGKKKTTSAKQPKSKPAIEKSSKLAPAQSFQRKVVMDEDQAGPDPGESRGALAGLDPELTHDEFMTDLYLKVQESLKFLADEHVFLEDPISLTRTLSSMKNLEDAYAIGDQFIHDKSTKDEPKKPNVEAEVVSMVTIPIYQASSFVPPLSTPVLVLDLSPPKPASSTTQAPIFTVTTTTTTTTTTFPPPPQQQSSTESELATRVISLEKKFSDLKQKNKTLDNTSRNLRSMVFILEVRDLPHKIDEAVCKSVKEAVHIALQAPLRDRFRELPEADMKEIIHQRMFKSDSYKSLPEHVALYEALEVSMERAQRDEFLAEKDKSSKRRRDDQDPPSPLLDSDLSKRRRHDTGAYGSSQPQAHQSSAWKKSNTRDAPLSSSKQQSGPYAEQPVKDILMPDTANISDSEDTDSVHLPKIKQRPEWLKPILDDERPATPEPACKGSGKALSISTIKAARYLDFGLELLKFYIDRHIADISRKVVRTHMHILSFVCIKVYSRYEYDYLKEITLRKADYQEYMIAEKDFKSLYPGDFEDLNLLHLQGHLNHLSSSNKQMLSTAVNLWTRYLVIRQRVKDFQLGIESYQKQLNLTKPGWDAKGFKFKHDYTIIKSPRAVVFPVDNNEWKIMRFNEIYKFSDGTLTNIMESLDYRVKEYKVNRLNPDSRPEGSFETWNALLAVEYEILITDSFREPNEHIISAF
nr:hypothetical protein [Tanacetum cinerariifolium]